MSDIPGLYTDNSQVRGIRHVSCEFIVGATGAVPATVTGGENMGTPVRNGVGDYSFPLSKTAVRLIDWHVEPVGPHSTTAGKYGECIADSANSLTAPLVRFQFTRGSDGAVAEVAQNDVLKVRLTLQYLD
jgi:hypothetical protein